MELLMNFTVRIVGLVFAIKLAFSLLNGVTGKLGDVAQLIGEDMGDKLCQVVLNLWVFLSTTVTKMTSALVKKKGKTDEPAEEEDVFHVDDIPDILEDKG